MELFKDMERLSGKTALIWEDLKEANTMALVLQNGQMGRDLKDILEVGKLMGRGNYNFLKVKSSKENLKTVMKIEKGSFNIWINQFLRVHGKMTKRKDLENIYHQMEQ